jgi:hypothetical protein
VLTSADAGVIDNLQIHRESTIVVAAQRRFDRDRRSDVNLVEREMLPGLPTPDHSTR